MKRVTLLLTALLLVLLTFAGLSLPSSRVMAACDWSYTYDFTVSDGGWLVDSDLGSYVEGVGFIPVDLGDGVWSLYLYQDYSPGLNLTEITQTYTITGGPIALHQDFFIYGDDFYPLSGDTTEDGTNTFDSGPSTFTNVNEIQTRLRPETANLVLQSLTLYGLGDNPFGIETDCTTPTPTPTATTEGGGGGPIVITVVVVYPTTEPTATPTEGPTPTATPDYVRRSTLVFGDTSYDVAMNLEVTPADYVQVGFSIVIVGLLMMLIFIFVKRGAQ